MITFSTFSERVWHTGAATGLVLLMAGCASAPPAPPPPVDVPFEQKMAWILRLEDQRILRFDVPVPPVVAPVVRRGRARAPLPAPPPTSTPDLTTLVHDREARVRRRAALAIGRVGLPEGVKPLTAALGDGDADVREMAAFAIGLIGVAVADLETVATKVSTEAASPLIASLADPSALVRGRAAEALGQIGAKQAAEPIARMAAGYARSPQVAGMKPDGVPYPAAPELDGFRLGIFALVRLRAYDALASAVLEPGGRPVTDWWPVAFALQRIGDPRAGPALGQLLQSTGRYTSAFAARGLGAARDPASVEALVALIARQPTALEPVVAAIRALAQIGDARGAPPLVALASAAETDPNVRLEAVTALGGLRAAEALPIVQDLMTDSWPSMRIAAIRAAASIDQDNFVLVVASMDPDRQWSVRAALADVMATLPAGMAVPRLRSMLEDEDKRVLPSVLRGLVRLKAPDGPALVLARLKDPDFALRAVAAALVGQLKPPGGAEALRDAHKEALADSACDARAAVLDALVEYGAADAMETVKAALADKDWAVRLRAVTLLARLDPAGDYLAAIRPAPGTSIAPYDDPELIAPPLSPRVFIETAKGTIEFELAVLDAPQTSRNFIALARKGFFNGLPIHRVVPNFVVQDGDSRGDGEGGPGYTIRDELNGRPFLRGTVGMALSWRDTGGSQFFITHSPQPHLDARYTAFGHVVNGMEVVDRIQQGDVIQRVRVWDGKTMQ